MSAENKKNFFWALNIAGLTINIRSELDIAFLNSERFLPFQTTSKKKEIFIFFHLIGSKDLTGPPLDPDSEPLLVKAGRRGTDSPLLRSKHVKARLHHARDHTDLLFVEIFPEALSILDFKSNRADFYYSPGSTPELEKRLIGPAMLAPFLPKFDACLLHASAIVRHGRTAVFLAPDEGGKTTAVRLSPSGTILCDDQVLVRRFPEGCRVSGTPWGLHVNAKVQPPLGGLFLLEKASRFALAPLATRDLVPPIWGEIKNSLSILPKPLKKKAFAIICEIVAAVPAWRMSFPKKHIDWEKIDQAMNKEVEGLKD